MITRDFDLWITQGHTKRLVFNANQYDQGETWRLRILGADGNPIVPTTAAIIGQKKDGHAILVEGTVSDGKVVITETEQMTACAGLTEFELLLNGETHGTANFTVQVEKRPGDDADFSDSDLSLIQDAVDAAETIIEVIGDGDPSEVIGEHVDAWLDNHPEATTTVLDGAITAPKINSTLWDKLLVNEEASGNPASFEDGADDVPVSSLKVALEPVQLGSGDPSPSNVRPIIAANGKNMMPSGTDGTYTDNGITCVCKGGVYTLTGTSTGSVTITIPLIASVDLSPSTNKIAFMNTQSVSLNVNFSRNGTNIHYWTMNTLNRVASGWTDSGNEVADSIRFTISSGVTVDCTLSPMLMLLSDDDYLYQPYQGIMVERKGINLFDASVANHGKRWKSAGLETMSNVSASAKIPCLPNTDYYLHDVAGENNGVPAVYFWDADDTYISNVVIQGTSPVSQMVTSPANAMYMGINYMTAQESTVGVNCNGVTEYVPYEGEKYPYTLGQSVYGGTVDLATGVLTVTHGIVDMGSLTWVYDTTRTCFATVLDGMKTFAPGDLATYVCDSYQTIAPTYSAGDGQNNTIWARVNETTFRVRDTSYTVAADFKAAVSGHQLVYELATPQTYQLTQQEVKTLLGYNNISSTGTVDVIYHADTKLYVDKMTNVDNAIIAPTEADFVATRNYTVNDLVIVNDTLYKVTANIASGSAITPNSNVTQTTLGALIKALS